VLKVGMKMPTLEQAVLWTVAYADVFDYPLTRDEIHWYLWGMPATCQDVEGVLRTGALCPAHLSYVAGGADDVDDGYYTLPGHEGIAALRHRRERIAASLWRKAWTYARMIEQLPFVRMVALTGSLAVGNVEPESDIDYLIVTERGRLWLCRASVIALGLLVARRHDVICPNYFLSENALVFKERNLYTAREFAQMIPLFGLDTHDRIQACNPWVQQYLPNARGLPCLTNKVLASKPANFSFREHRTMVKKAAEVTFRTRPGTWLEQWEMRRKLRKFSRQWENHPESNFGPDCCKGHFNDHMARTLASFAQRLQGITVGRTGSWVGETEASCIEDEMSFT
jgi:hypothetical protein